MAPRKQHPYRKLILPPNAPFELRPAPTKGWGAFATKDIQEGVQVLDEKPLFWTSKCLPGLTEAELVHKVTQLTEDQRSQLSLLRINGDRNKKFPTLLAAFQKHKFTTGTREGGHHTGHSFQVIASRFNHSCTPNLSMPPCGCEATHFLATRPISAGTELTFAYAGDLSSLTRAERRTMLNWECRCETCSLGAEALKESDKRRRTIRGLLFLISGYDLAKADHPQLTSSLVVPTEEEFAHPESFLARDFVLDVQELTPSSPLLRAAQQSRIPGTRRFVYCGLVLALLEKEGILPDKDTSRPVVSVMEDISEQFRACNNRMLADTVLKTNKNWCEKFRMIGDIYGRAVVCAHSFGPFGLPVMHPFLHPMFMDVLSFGNPLFDFDDEDDSEYSLSESDD